MELSINNKIDRLAKLYDFGEIYALDILREDLIHPFVSGNKYRKLKYNLKEALNLRYNTLLTFGGAHSNHIAATAAAGKDQGFETIGVIRGEEVSEKIQENPTLSFAQSCGMQLVFVSRSEYKLKTSKTFIEQLKSRFGDFYLLPEGGTNELAVKGCQEILSSATSAYDYICVSVGTGGTIAGIIESSLPQQKTVGFSALKGTFQKETIQKYSTKKNFQLTDEYCFGGYAKIDRDLVRFINEFKEKTQIQLDPIYTGKMMFGIMDMIKKEKFKKNSRILAIHTGGLQGIQGMNQLLKKKNLPQIEI